MVPRAKLPYFDALPVILSQHNHHPGKCHCEFLIIFLIIILISLTIILIIIVILSKHNHHTGKCHSEWSS